MKILTLRAIVTVFYLTIMSTIVNAQSTPLGKEQNPPAKSESASKSSIEDWKELKDFHKVMAQTFHPMEEGDYKPIKERSGELAEKARLLADSKVPVEFSKPEMLQAVQELNAGCRSLDAMIKNRATDQEISKSLSSLHDTFHKIVGLCQPGHDEEKHDHSDPNHKH